MDRVRDREALLTGRSRSPREDRAPYCYAFRAMGGQHELQVWAEDRLHADRAAKAAITDVLRIEAKYSRYREDSVTAAINRGATRGPVDR